MQHSRQDRPEEPARPEKPKKLDQHKIMKKRGFVKKYKTFEAARKDQWVFKPGQAYFEKVLLMHSMGLLKRIGEKCPRGVFKYKNFEDAQKEELEWILMD